MGLLSKPERGIGGITRNRLTLDDEGVGVHLFDAPLVYSMRLRYIWRVPDDFNLQCLN